MKENFCLFLIIITLTCCKRTVKPIEENTKSNKPTLVFKSDTSSEDKVFLYYFDSLLTKKNTTLCNVSKQLLSIEDSTIHIADQKYPDFGIKHNEYQEQLYKKEYKKLFKELGINDSLVYYINTFSYKYCK